MNDDDFDELEGTVEIPPPYLIIGRAGKKVKKIIIGIKRDTITIIPDKKGRFIVDLNNLKGGWKYLSEINIKIK